MKPTVYLSGPMAGLSYEQANKWRVQVQKELGSEILCLNPLRGLEGNSKIKKHYPSPKGGYGDYSLTRDFLDTKRSDLILVNLLDAKEVSIGTVMEIAWAYALQKPIIVAIGEEDFVHKHGLLEASINVIVRDLEEMVYYAKEMLLSP